MAVTVENMLYKPISMVIDDERLERVPIGVLDVTEPEIVFAEKVGDDVETKRKLLNIISVAETERVTEEDGELLDKVILAPFNDRVSEMDEMVINELTTQSDPS